jgi:SOS response regulatory protein OraA/RecX
MDETLSKALESLARYLAMRDHSEAELRTKMRRRFDLDVIEKALEFARSREWLTAPEKLAKKATEELNRRKKSHRYIQNALRKRGLPATRAESSEEMEKIRQLLRSKFVEAAELSYEEKANAYRFLRYRGFEDALIRKVLNEKLD